jgi:hypothetical protein
LQKDEWISFEDQVAQVAMVSITVVRVNKHAVSPDGIISPTPVGWAVVSRMPRPRDRAVVLRTSSQLRFFGSRATTPLAFDVLRLDQGLGSSHRRSLLSSSTVSGTTAALTHNVLHIPDLAQRWNGSSFGPHLSTLPNPARLWRWVWWRHRDRKVNDFLWQLAHRRLSLGENIWRWTDEVGCLCGQHLETADHLFLDCSVTAPVMRWFRRVWRQVTGHDLSVSVFAGVVPASPTKKRRAYWHLLALAYPDLLYSIWLQRCSAVFDDAAFVAVAIAPLFRFRLRRSIEAAASLRRVSGFTALANNLTTALAAATV